MSTVLVLAELVVARLMQIHLVSVRLDEAQEHHVLNPHDGSRAPSDLMQPSVVPLSTHGNHDSGCDGAVADCDTRGHCPCLTTQVNCPSYAAVRNSGQA